MANTYPGKRPLSDRTYTAQHADVTVATASAYAVMVAPGWVQKVMTVIDGAITGADETLNLYKNGSDTGADITITQSGSAAGDVDYVELDFNDVTVIEGDVLTLVSANASGGTTAAAVTYIVRDL